MEGARISQFNPDGTLLYRLNTARLLHFPDQRYSLLEVPRLHFIRDPAEPPWDMQSNTGRVDYIDTPEGEREVVTLSGDVRLRRERPAEDRFLQLETATLTVFPDQAAAETREAAMITTEVGTSAGIGLRADLDTGQVDLGTVAGQRVTTMILKTESLAP